MWLCDVGNLPNQPFKGMVSTTPKKNLMAWGWLKKNGFPTFINMLLVNFHLGWFTKKGPHKSPKSSVFTAFYERFWDLWGPFLGDQPKWKISTCYTFSRRKCSSWKMTLPWIEAQLRSCAAAQLRYGAGETPYVCLRSLGFPEKFIYRNMLFPRIQTYTGWWVFCHPSEKSCSSSVGVMTFPIYGKISKPPTNK